MLSDWGYYLIYFSLFGFWDVIFDQDTFKRRSKRRLFVDKIIPTELGVELAKILKEERDLERWNIPYRQERGEWNIVPGSPLGKLAPEFSDPIMGLLSLMGIEYEAEAVEEEDIEEDTRLDDWQEEEFFKAFIPLFPEGELEKTITQRERSQLRAGSYLFKISLNKDNWCRIKLSANHTLLDLHEAIQDVFYFWDDHLYAFFLGGKAWTGVSFTSPHDPEGIPADQVKIGELGLDEGQEILYLFDYGDEWRFEVRLENIDEEEAGFDQIELIEKEGDPPEQYPDY